MSRADTIKTERRRRNTDALGGARGRLSVTAELDRDNYVYRWANDTGNRLHQLTVQDDWDIVTSRDGDVKENSSGIGAEVAVPVGTGDQGRPVRAVLLRKPKHLHIDDKRQEQRRIDETEAGLKAGVAPGSGMATGESYVPRGGISIENGSRS